MATKRGAHIEDEQAADAAREVVLLFRLLRRRMRVVPADGLSSPQSAVLLRLDRDGASSTTLLAAAEGVRSQSMTVTLNALESQGLIERRPDPEDGRRSIVTASDAGRARVRDGRELRQAWLAKVLRDHLSSSELATVNRSIALIASALESENEDR